MDENNPTSGTLFDTIQIINKKMIDKINLKLDLTKDPIMQHDISGEDGIPVNKIEKNKEEKIDSYILKFVNLNFDNQEILDNVKKNLD